MTHRRSDTEPPSPPWRSRLFTWANGLRALGASGFVVLLLSRGTERPTYMIACLALMGLPNAFQFDRKRDRE